MPQLRTEHVEAVSLRCAEKASDAEERLRVKSHNQRGSRKLRPQRAGGEGAGKGGHFVPRVV
jgi:hypothetical protein